MDKNSLILEIKNEINSIKKQLDITLAKIDVLEALIKLEVTTKGGELTSAASNEELGVKEEPKFVPVVEPEPEVVVEQVVEPIVELTPVQEVEPESVVEIEASFVTEPVVEPEPVVEEQVIEPEKEEIVTLRNLMSVIGLNDRFRFRHDLFSDNNDLFKETIEILNAIENFDKAVDYLQEKFNWDEEDATVVYFYDIIKPKF